MSQGAARTRVAGYSGTLQRQFEVRSRHDHSPSRAHTMFPAGVSSSAAGRDQFPVRLPPSQPPSEACAKRGGRTEVAPRVPPCGARAAEGNVYHPRSTTPAGQTHGLLRAQSLSSGWTNGSENEPLCERVVRSSSRPSALRVVGAAGSWRIMASGRNRWWFMVWFLSHSSYLPIRE